MLSMVDEGKLEIPRSEVGTQDGNVSQKITY